MLNRAAFYLRVSGSALIVLLVLLAEHSWADKDLKRQIDTKRSEIRALDKQLRRTRRDIGRLRHKEGRVSQELKDTEEKASQLRLELDDLLSQEQETSGQIASTESDLASAALTLQQREAEVAGRLRTMYKRQRLSGIELVLSADSFTSLVRRSRYLSRTARQDRIDCERIRADRDEIAKLKSSLEDRRAELRGVAARVEGKSRDLSEEEERRRALLRSVRGSLASKQTTQERLRAEKAASTARLSSLIADYQKSLVARRAPRGQRSIPAPQGARQSFPARRGALPWPATGRVLEEFGRQVDERLGTVTFNRGIDIAVPPGVDVCAVAAGRVVAVEWMRGYGNVVVLHHGGDYFTVYAHLSATRCTAGQDVERGQTIGSSGSSGSLDGPKLHFEVLKGRDAMDPLAWLSK